MDIRFPELFLLLPFLVWFLVRAFRVTLKPTKSPWFFLLQSSSNRRPVTQAKINLLWLPLALGFLAYLLILTVSVKPSRLLTPTVWISQPKLLASQNQTFIDEWIKQAQNMLGTNHDMPLAVKTTSGTTTLTENMGSIKTWLKQQKNGQPNTDFLKREGSKLISGRQDLYKNLPFLSLEPTPTFAITSIRQLKKDDHLIQIKRRDGKLNPLQLKSGPHEREVLFKSSTTTLRIKRPIIHPLILKNKSSGESFVATWHSKVHKPLKWESDLEIPLNLKKILESSHSNRFSLQLTNHIKPEPSPLACSWIILDGQKKHPLLNRAPVDMPLRASTTSYLKHPGRHLLFDYNLKSSPAYILSGHEGHPLLKAGSADLIKVVQRGSSTTLIQCIPFSSLHFHSTEQEVGFYRLCLSALNLVDLEGKPVFNYQYPEKNRRDHSSRRSNDHLASGTMLSFLVLSVLLFALAGHLRKAFNRE